MTLPTTFDPERTADLIQSLVDGIPDLDQAEKDLGLDLRGLVKLLDAHPHNDDIHHSGETPLEHIRWVLEDVPKVASGPEQQRLLGLVALLHDLGKAYTYELIEGKHTFRKHGKVSLKLTEVMLHELRDSDPQLYQRVCDLVRLHDIFMVLIEARKGAKDLKYLNKLLREPVYTEGHLDDLVAFSRADGFRAKRYQDTARGMDEILATIEGQKRAAEEAKAQKEQALRDHMEEIRQLLVEAPEALAALPNLREVNKALGQRNRLDLIQRLQSLLAG
jgi:hypothetical protein